MSTGLFGEPNSCKLERRGEMIWQINIKRIINQIHVVVRVFNQIIQQT